MPSSLAIHALQKGGLAGRMREAGGILPRLVRESTPRQLGAKLLDATLHQLHQFLDSRGIEDEPSPGSAVDLGQAANRTERERLAIASHRGSRIGQTVAPDLKRPQLSDTVLDVIEGVHENVQLPVPAGHALLVQPGPIDAPLESASQ